MFEHTQGLTFSIVTQFVVLRSEVAVSEGAQAIGEVVAPPLPIVVPVVELVGGASLVSLGHRVADDPAWEDQRIR